MATLGSESARSLPLLTQLESSLLGQNQNGNPPPNRGLERALDVAAASGVLNLSARKLKEFPRTAANHDLSDTVQADLSKNRLIDMPSEICFLVALESLNLYHNCIRTIPSSIIRLQSLTSLNISRNQLSFLPSCLHELPLRVLNASNNKLVNLPETIWKLHSLMELDVSCNEITALPRHIGRLRALRELNIRRNLLCVLPDDLAELPLVKFDFSCNKVSTIPVCFRKMKLLQILRLDNNPLQTPPAQICIKGKVHIFKYLSMEACRSDRMPDSVYLSVIEHLSLSRPSTGSVEDMEQLRKQDGDSGVGSDIGDKRLSANEHITEEEGLDKDDSSEHISSLTVDSIASSVRLIEDSPTEALMAHLDDRDSPVSARFHSYIKGRTAADFDEPLRIDEDSHWSTEQRLTGSNLPKDMIKQLKEAVQLLQDPSRVNSDQQELLSGVQLYPLEIIAGERFVRGQENEVRSGSQSQNEHLRFSGPRKQQLHRPSTSGYSAFSTPPFNLKPRSAPPSLPCSPPTGRVDHSLLLQASPSHRGKHCSHRDGGSHMFLKSHVSLESVDPQFTIRRKMEQLREEVALMDQLRNIIESRLKVVLPEDLGSSLMDGVVLCHLANHIQPRSIASIHVPSPAVPKLSMAKCRRNVENFLDACRKIGVEELSLCSPLDILARRLQPLLTTVRLLVSFDGTNTVKKMDKCLATSSEYSKSLSLLSVATQTTPAPAWQMWELVGSSLVHILCLVLLFVIYSWSEKR
ncbi:leucine-rich repeat and calponin homology domain-containing protein 1 isoform X2 [Synchiropus splendidus]|uniref:leucine-rich repeat and calponin homology domain-containing protein 1 isoform X2 n=1 Tax=Synchiropus splendidus TaxID=270530 RepID=UPI00237EE37C|nr:leucine-rich repeat and calponin homology domain-containing protein 1 isoform X2 [Synchiropus splendidus]